MVQIGEFVCGKIIVIIKEHVNSLTKNIIAIQNVSILNNPKND